MRAPHELTLSEKYRYAANFNKYTVLKTAEGWLALGPGLLLLGEVRKDFEDAHIRVQEKIKTRKRFG